METLSSSTIICPQCAGENHISIDDKFIECEFCGSAIYIDKSKVVTHYVIVSNFSKENAEGNLRRWMAGNFQVKDLDKLANITKVSFYYFPMWYFKTGTSDNDKIYLQPATSTSVSEIKKINIPAGSLKVFNKKEFNENDFIPPDIYFDSAQKWLSESGVDLNTITLSSLVHIPFYQFTYEYNGKEYTAMVETSSGMVYANVWPAKSESPFRVLYGVSIILFLFISILAFIISNSISRTKASFFLDVELIKIIGYLLVSIPLIIIAYIIAKKV